MPPEDHPTHKPQPLDPRLNAALDQASAAVRDCYDQLGINTWEPATRLAILTTWDLINRSEPNYQIGLYAIARALNIG